MNDGRNLDEIFRKDVTYENIRSRKKEGFTSSLQKMHIWKIHRGDQIDLAAFLGLKGF